MRSARTIESARAYAKPLTGSVATDERTALCVQPLECPPGGQNCAL